MLYNYLGNTGLKVSRLSFGNWVTCFSLENQKNYMKCFELAYKNGINFFDTSELYGEGEKILGSTIKNLKIPREHLVIATKLYRKDPMNKTNKMNDFGLSRKKILGSVKVSLKKL